MICAGSPNNQPSEIQTQLIKTSREEDGSQHCCSKSVGRLVVGDSRYHLILSLKEIK